MMTINEMNKQIDWMEKWLVYPFVALFVVVALYTVARISACEFGGVWCP